ncbi:MAG: N-acetyltransferase [Candidatus Kapaibacterium sp.]|nr:MAG: N-acetyltransferase [Candidatus Kapabacteria bacterium]
MEIIIQHQTHANGGGQWFVEDPESKEILAKLVYNTRADGALTLDSTVVSDVLRGKNVGKRLVNEASALARLEQRKLVPVCPFVVALFEKLPQEYGDVQAA